jgi:hypothetical protein
MWNLFGPDANKTWLLIPLVIVVSLVYSASRYEHPQRILHKATRLFLTIMGFMAVVFGLLTFLSHGL